MYAGYVDGRLLFAVGMDGYEITSGTIHQALGECDSADFKLPASNTMRDVPVKRASVISIRRDGKEVFRGSVADTSTDLRGGRTYSVDGAMLWFADIRKPPFVMTEDTVTYYVTALLTQYNAACLPAKQIQLGTIDTTLPSLAVEQTEYKTILALLQEGMQAVGGTLRIRYEDGGIYLDVLKAYNHRCAQQVDIRKNLLDLTDKIDGADLITRVYPIGKDGLTIASVNDGATYLANAAAEALYGRIDGTLRVDTDDAAALKVAAATYLAQHCGLSRGIQVSAADLSGTDITLEPYHIGDSVRVVSPPHGIDTIMTVSKLDTSLVGGKDTMTLGWSSRTLTAAVASGGGGASSGTTTSGGGGAIDVDSALSTTSTNPVQNKVVTAALAGKASTATATQSSAGLMSEADKAKLDGIAEGATKITVDSELSSGSTNPIMNGAITVALSGKADQADLVKKLDKTGGTIFGNLKLAKTSEEGTGSIDVEGNIDAMSGTTRLWRVYVTNNVDSDQQFRAPLFVLSDPLSQKSVQAKQDGNSAVKIECFDNAISKGYARLKIGTPTEDDDAATAGYVKAAIPTTLKNPNALTIKIGGTSVTYDGSAAKTVEIADGSEVSY
nr:MAG TPA: tail protein [Caudoviricetes sp.]